MPRLPDIPLQSWLEDQQKRFYEATEGFFPSLDFQLGTKTTEAEIPPDFDAPGGMDQWREAEERLIEREQRIAQQQDEERRQQEIEAMAEQFRQQQLRDEEAQRQQDEQNRSAVMEQIRGLGIPTPSDAFSMFKQEEPRDDQATTGVFDHSLPAGSGDAIRTAVDTGNLGTNQSPVEQFNAFATGLYNSAFKQAAEPADEPTPDNSSTTGLLDQLGAAASSAGTAVLEAPGAIRSAVDQGLTAIEDSPIYPGKGREGGFGDPVGALRNIERGAGYLVDEFGAERVRREINELGVLEDEVREASPPGSIRDEILPPVPSPEWEAANPDKARRLEELREKMQGIVVGASGTMGAGGMADDAFNAIRTLIRAGHNDAAIAAEKTLAEKLPMTLAQIREKTRGVRVPGAQTAEESGESPPIPPQSTSLEPMLPGFEDVAQRTTREGEGVRGFGTLPESTTPGPTGGMNRTQEQMLRETQETLFSANRPLTAAERRQAVADVLDVDPGAVARAEAAAQNIDPRQAGITQEMLKQNVRYKLDQWDTARQQWNDVKAEIDELVQQGIKPSQIDESIQARAAQINAKLLEHTIDLQTAVKGQSLSAQAASKALNAQKSGFLGAYALRESERLDDVAKAAGEAAGGIQQAQKTGVVGEGTLGPLRNLRSKLTGAGNRRAVTKGGAAQEIEEVGTAAGRGGRGGGATRTAARARPRPESETLAERLGWLDRERRQLELSGAPDEEFARNHAEFQETVQQAQKAAREAAQKRMQAQANRAPLTPDEEQKIINEAVGRRYITKFNREARAATPTIDPQTDASLMRALTRHYQDAEKLTNSIDAQINRRIDGMVATEARKEIREQVREMAKAAQINARALLKDPTSLNRSTGQHNEEQFDLMMRQLEAHSETGRRVATDMRERFWANMGKKVTQQEDRRFRLEEQMLTDDQINDLLSRIDDVIQNPRAPGRLDHLNDLYRELADINSKGSKKASELRRKAHETGILKSGVFAKDADKGALMDMLADIDPKDPKSFQAIMNVMNRPNLWHLAREISLINLLSNPVTHLKNMTSTLINGGLWLGRQPLEFIGSGGELSAGGAALRGMKQGVKPGYKLAAETMRSGINPSRLEDAVMTGNYDRVNREVLPQFMEKYGSKPAARVGQLWHQFSTRPLEAGDAFLGNIMYSGAIAQQAQREADHILKIGAKIPGFALDTASGIPPREQVMSHILNNIWDYPKLIEKAGKIEDYSLFKSRSPDKLEEALRFLMRRKNPEPGADWKEHLLGLGIDFVIPFYNTLYNYAKQGLGNTIAPLYQPARFARAAARGDRAVMGESFAKALQGGAMIATPAFLYAAGDLTGAGPSDPGDRRIWEQTHRPNSFRILGSDWMSYEGTPWAIPFAAVAGAAEELEFKKKKDPHMSPEGEAFASVTGGLKGAGRGILSQSLIEGVVRNFNFLTGQQLGEQDLATGLANTVLRYNPLTAVGGPPSGLMGFLAQMTDAVERNPGRAQDIEDVYDPEGPTVNAMKNRIPGLRQTLPEKTDAFGEVVPNERRYGKGLIPYYMGPAPGEGDPIAAQLERGSVGVSIAPEELTVGIGTVPLTIREQQRFQEVFGQRWRAMLEKYGAGTKSIPEDVLESWRSDAREYASRVVEQEIGKDEFRRRWKRREKVEVAP